nr:hypothetical protein [Tanacetum cinerariifolium]
MSNTNNNLQTQTSNALYNAIMEAGGKDRPLMLAPEGSSETTTEGYMENYKNVSQDIRNQLDAEVKAVQIILTEIDNDIYCTVDACLNAWFYKMMNELVRNKCDVTNHQSQKLKTVSYHKLYDILKQHQNKVKKIRAEILVRTANPLALVTQQQPVYLPQNHPTHYTQNSPTRPQQAATRNKEKAIVNSPQPIYDQKPKMFVEDDALSKEKEIAKLIDNTSRINRGISYDNQRAVNVVGARENVGTQVVQQYGIPCYNCKEYGHVARECQKSKWAKNAAYHKEKMLLCRQKKVGFQLNAKQADWRDDTDDEPKDQELEVYYIYMTHIQEVTSDGAEPLQKVQNDNDNYNVFSNDSEHLEQPEYVNDTYPDE